MRQRGIQPWRCVILEAMRQENATARWLHLSAHARANAAPLICHLPFAICHLPSEADCQPLQASGSSAITSGG